MIKNLLKWRLFKGIAIVVLIAFVSMIPAQSGYAQTFMPAPGQMVRGTSSFTPTLMKGLRVDISNPFNLYFLMSDGEKALAGDARQQEYEKLIKYFMASLVIPNRDMWVNLSPKESTRIIPDNFSMTDMGRDLLSQDYLLKQFTASLMYPEDDLGKQFWNQIYQKAYQEYGTTDIPVDTFNKVWIKVDRADIYQKDDTAFVVKSHLKVMLEQDLLAAQGSDGLLQDGISEEADSGPRKMASDIVRNVIIPVIEKEVNEGGNFATVRQAYHAMILATWFKKTLKDTLLGQVYADQSKVDGIALNDPQAKDRIYQQYLAAYKTGVFNYIKEEYDSLSQETLPRKYFAGGLQALSPDGRELAMAHPALARMALTGDRFHQDVLFVNLVEPGSGRVFENRAAFEQDQSQKAMATIKEEKAKNAAQQAQAKEEVEKKRQSLTRELDKVNAQRVKALAAVANASARVNRVAVHKKERAMARQTLLTWLANKFQKVLLVTAIAQSLFAIPVKAAEAPNMPLPQTPVLAGSPVAGSMTINTNAVVARQREIKENKDAQAAIEADIETALRERAAKEAGRNELLRLIQIESQNNIKVAEIPLDKQIAHLEKQIELNNDVLQQRIKPVALPVNIGLVLGQGGPLGSYSMPLGSSSVGPAAVIAINYPGKDFVDAGSIIQGMATGGSSAIGMYAGPAVLLDMVLRKKTEFDEARTKGQSERISDRSDAEAFWNTISPISFTKKRSWDQNGLVPVETKALRVGPLQNLTTAIGRLGRIFDKKSDLRGIAGGADGGFTWDKEGVFIPHEYQKVFHALAAQNPGQRILFYNEFSRFNGVVSNEKFIKAAKKDGVKDGFALLATLVDQGILEKLPGKLIRLKRDATGATKDWPAVMSGDNFRDIRRALRPDQKYVITDEKKGTFRKVAKDESIADPYYDTQVIGWMMVDKGIDPATGNHVWENYQFYNGYTLMNNDTAEKISGVPGVTADYTILQPVWSTAGLKMELRYKQGEKDGGSALGIRRFGVNMLPQKVITQWPDVLGVRPDQKGVLRFPSAETKAPIQLAPARPAHEFTTGERLWSTVTSSFTDPLEWLKDTSGAKKAEEYAKDGKYKGRPIKDQLPYGFGKWEDRLDDRFDLGRRLLDLEVQIQNTNNAGAIYHLYDKQPEIIPDAGGLKATLEKHSLKNTFWMAENSKRATTDPKHQALPANATVEGDSIRVTYGSGRSLLLPPGTLVQIEDGRVTGLFRPNIATMKSWIDQAPGEELSLRNWVGSIYSFGFTVDPRQENPVLVPVSKDAIGDYEPLKFQDSKLTNVKKDPATGDYILDGISKPVSGDAMVRIQDGKVVEIFVPGVKAIEARNVRLAAEQKALEAGAREVGVEVLGEPGRFIPTIFTRGPVSADQAPFKMGGEDRLVGAVASNHVQVASGVDEAGHVYWEPQITLAQQPVKAGFSPAETAPTMTEFLAKNIMASFLRDGVIAKSEFSFNDRDGKGRFPEGQEIRGALKAKGILKEVPGGLQLESRENLEKIVRDSKMSFQDILFGTVRDVFKGGQRGAFTEQDAVRKIWGVLHQGQFIPLKDLENPDTIARLRAEATEIIDLEAELGHTVARRVPTFHADGKAGYEKVPSAGMEGYLKNNGLVINGDGSFGFRPVTDLAKPGAFDPKIKQVLKIGLDGRTAGYMVPIWNNNKSDMHYADKSVGDLEGFLRDNGVVISKDGEHAGFTSVQDPAHIDVPRADVKEFLIIGPDGSTTGRMLPMLNGGWVRVNTPEKAMAALGQGILGWLKTTLALGALAAGLELPLGAAEMPQVAPQPAPIVAPAVPGIADFVKENFLVLTGDPNSFGFVSAKELASSDIRFVARQILVMNSAGEPIESMVPVWGSGYQRVSNAEMGIVLRSQLPTNDVVRGTQLDPAASGSIFKFIPTKDGTEPKAVVLNPENEMVEKARAAGHFNKGEVEAVAGKKGFAQVWPVLQGISLAPFNKTHAFVVTRAGAELAEYERSTPKADQDPKKLEALKAAARATPMGFIEVEKLKDLATHEKVRLAADGIEMQDESENVVARIYLDPAFDSSRIEIIDDAARTSRLYDLSSYKLGGNMAPVEITTYEDVRGEDSYLHEQGEFRHVSKTDTRRINSDIKDIKVTDVYAKETIGVREDGKPILKLTLRYSIRELQQEVIFYRTGDDGRQRESYYISTDMAKDKGFSVVIDGKLKENVVHLTKSASMIDPTSGAKTVVSQGVSLRGLRDNGGYASARIQRYEADRLKEDVTGFVKLDLAALEAGALSEQEIQDYARDHRILRLDDPYTYNPDGSEKQRDVRLNADQSNDPAKASWKPGWTITAGGEGKQSEMMKGLLQHSRIKKTFDQYGLNADTSWIAGLLRTEQNVLSTTFRVKGDSRQKPFITKREEAGRVLDYTVGLELDKSTGSPVVAYVLTADFQIKAIRMTVPNDRTVRQLIEKYGAEAIYTALTGRHFPNNMESLEQQFANIGISLDLKPTRVMEIPMLLKMGTEDPGKLDYRTIEPLVRPLVEKYMSATDQAGRDSILLQIQKIVQTNRSAREIGYSSDQGLATDHYLIPNDSRGRDAFQIMPNGDLEIPMWWFEGHSTISVENGAEDFEAKPVVGIMPGVMVIDKDGKYKHSLVFEKTEPTPAVDPQGITHPIQANSYKVLDAEFMLGAKLSPGGRVMREYFRHLVHRVAAGKLGVETEGVEEIVYDMFSPFQVPLYGLKTGQDGTKRITQVPEVEAFSSVPTSSKVNKLPDTVRGHDLVSEERKDPVTDITSLEMEATAPGIYKSKTTHFEQNVSKEKRVEGIWSGYWQDLKNGKNYIGGLLGAFFGLLALGGVTGWWQLGAEKRKARRAMSGTPKDSGAGSASGTPASGKKSGTGTESAMAQASESAMAVDAKTARADIEAIWKKGESGETYGFSKPVWDNARRVLETSVMSRIERGNEKVQDIIDEHFAAYQVYRREYVKADVIKKDEFSKADPVNGEAVLKELIKKGILEEVGSAAVRLKQKADGSFSRPAEIEGKQFDAIWSVLRFTPSVEDIFVLHLILGGSDILSNDMPDYISYLFHKSIEARKKNGGQLSDFGGFVRKEYTRWHNILQVQITTFQGLQGGDVKHVVPYQYYFRQDDLNDLFRMRNPDPEGKTFIEWYDGLEHSLDGKSDKRDVLYAAFQKDLSGEVGKLMKVLQGLAFSRDEFSERHFWLGPKKYSLVALLEKVGELGIEITKDALKGIEKFGGATIADVLKNIDSDSSLTAEAKDVLRATFLDKLLTLDWKLTPESLALKFPGRKLPALPKDVIDVWNKVKKGQPVGEADYRKSNRILLETLFPKQCPIAAVRGAGTTAAGVNVFRMKRMTGNYREYRDYIDYFKKKTQGGAWKLSQDVTKGEGDKKEMLLTVKEASDLIDDKPLMPKTFSDVGAENGKAPFIWRGLKSMAQVLKNTFKPFAATIGLNAASLVIVLLLKGLAGPALIVGIGAVVALVVIYGIVKWYTSGDISTAFGTPLDSWIGYKQEPTTLGEKLYRVSFWGAFTILKLAMNVAMIHFLAIPLAVHWAATWTVFQTAGSWALLWPLLGKFAAILTATPIVLFFLLDPFSIVYLLEAIYGFVHGKIFLRLGTIKTGRDIRKLQADRAPGTASATNLYEEQNSLNELMDAKLLPKGIGLESNPQRRVEARKMIWEAIFKQMRERDEISDEEYDAAIMGTLDKFKSARIQKRIAVAVNAFVMDMPDMPKWEDIKSVTIMNPVFGEDIIYAYDVEGELPKDLSTALDFELNVGFTNLNKIILNDIQSWMNLIERVEKKNSQRPDGDKKKNIAAAIARMKELVTKRGKLGPIDEDLKMEIRLWASYRVQPYARTLDGEMNHVRMLNVLAKINHPEWTEDQRREEVEKKFQMLWAYQVWGDTLKADAFEVADGDLNIARFQESLKENKPIDVLLSQVSGGLVDKTGKNAGKFVARALNYLMPMRDLYKRISVDPYKAKLNKDALALLDRIERGDPSLTGGDYARFNRYLLEAIYSDGIVTKAGKPDQVKALKKKDVIFLLKKYHEELNFDIQVASLQERDFQPNDARENKIWHKVLSRYDPDTKETTDDFVIPLTGNRPIITEGKPGNQTHARSFATGEVTLTMDMNQDFYPEQIIKLPILMSEFDIKENKNAAIIGYPEDIFTDGFSREGESHAIADRTFNTLTQRVLTKLGVRFHYGHPDIWRSSSAKIFGGVSSSSAVNEDIFAAMVRKMKGQKILYREYIEAGKARELSWGGTDGILRKFGMGGLQQALGRFVNQLFKMMPLNQGMAHFYAGIGYYIKKPIVLVTLFSYITFTMLLGFSGFVAMPAAGLIALLGIVLLGQAIVMDGFMQKVIEDGFWKGFKAYGWILLFMTPFFMAHVVTASVGAISALLGVAAYVATGRGFNLEHLSISDIFKSYGKSHILVGFIGSAISLAAILLWANATLVASAPFVLIFIAAMVMPILLNPGGLPIRGTTWATFRDRFLGERITQDVLFKDGKIEKDAKIEKNDKAVKLLAGEQIIKLLIAEGYLNWFNGRVPFLRSLRGVLPFFGASDKLKKMKEDQRLKDGLKKIIAPDADVNQVIGDISDVLQKSKGDLQDIGEFISSTRDDGKKAKNFRKRWFDTNIYRICTAVWLGTVLAGLVVIGAWKVVTLFGLIPSIGRGLFNWIVRPLINANIWVVNQVIKVPFDFVKPMEPARTMPTEVMSKVGESSAEKKPDEKKPGSSGGAPLAGAASSSPTAPVPPVPSTPTPPSVAPKPANPPSGATSVGLALALAAAPMAPNKPTAPPPETAPIVAKAENEAKVLQGQANDRLRVLEEIRRELAKQIEELEKKAKEPVKEPEDNGPEAAKPSPVVNPPSVITSRLPITKARLAEIVDAEEANIRGVVQKQRDRIKGLEKMKADLEMKRGSSPDWRYHYRRVSTQLGALQKTTLGKLLMLLDGREPYAATVAWRDEIRQLQTDIEGLRKVKTPDAADQLLVKRAQLAETRNKLAFVLKLSHAFNIEELGFVTEAVRVLAPQKPGDPMAIVTLDQKNVEAVVAEHVGAGQGIRFFASLPQKEKLAALDATILQVNAQNIMLSGKAREDGLNDYNALTLAREAVSKNPVGGIDFNSEDLMITIEMDSNGIPLAARFQDPRVINIPGLKPVIRSIQPLDASNIPALYELVK